MGNRISIHNPEDRLIRIREVFAVIRCEFGPFGESLTPKGRQKIANMVFTGRQKVILLV